jgi:sugar phosphate permease
MQALNRRLWYSRKARGTVNQSGNCCDKPDGEVMVLVGGRAGNAAAWAVARQPSGYEGAQEMSQSKKATRQQAVTQRQARRRRRMAMLIGGPLVILAIVAIVLLTSKPGYSGLDVIGKQPAIIQVFLPG